jgi:hypothetical protein
MDWYNCSRRALAAALAPYLLWLARPRQQQDHCYVLVVQVSRGCTGVHIRLVALCVRRSYEACYTHGRQDLRVQGPPLCSYYSYTSLQL